MPLSSQAIDSWSSNNTYFRSPFLKSSVIHALLPTLTGDAFFTPTQWNNILTHTALIQHYLKGLTTIEQLEARTKAHFGLNNEVPTTVEKPLPNDPILPEHLNDKLISPFFYACLIGVAIETSNLPLLAFLIDPLPNPSKSWETRTSEASKLIQASSSSALGGISDEQIIMDMAVAVSAKPEAIFIYCFENSLKHRLIVELSTGQSLTDDLVVMSPFSPGSPGSQPVPFIELALDHCQFQIISSMLTHGIKISYHKHFRNFLDEDQQRIFCSKLVEAEAAGQVDNIELVKAICSAPPH